MPVSAPAAAFLGLSLGLAIGIVYVVYVTYKSSSKLVPAAPSRNSGNSSNHAYDDDPPQNRCASGEEKCVICGRPANVRNEPCGHKQFCEKCFAKVSERISKLQRRASQLGACLFCNQHIRGLPH